MNRLHAGTGALLAALVTACGAGSSTHPVRSASPSGTPTTSKPSTSSTVASPVAGPPADFAQTRLLGANGRYVWKLTDKIKLTADLGAHWSQVTLPAGVRPGAVDRIQVGSDGTLFVADSRRDQHIDLYRRGPDATGWAKTVLTPLTPGTGYPPPYPNVIRADGDLVVVIAGWVTTPAYAFTDLFQSTNGGATFTQRHIDLDRGVQDALFVNARTGLIVAGPGDNLIYRTTDGGRHWTRVRGGPVTRDVTFGQLTRTAAGIEVPRVVGRRVGADVYLDLSTDAGATFTPTVAKPLHISRFVYAGKGPSGVPVAVHGSQVWVLANNQILTSTDQGRSWTTVHTRQQLSDVDLIGGSQAIGTSGADCRSNSGGCWTTDYLVASDDGGRTWNTL